jgi:hypothetical protein
MRNFPDYGNNAASHTVVGHHFEPNPLARAGKDLLAVNIHHIYSARAVWNRGDHNTLCACNGANSPAHGHRFRLVQFCSDSFHLILLLWMDGILWDAA